MADAIFRLQNDSLSNCLTAKGRMALGGSVLEGFLLTEAEAAKCAGLEVSRVRPVLDAFSLGAQERNPGFKTLHDFNVINAAPLIQMGEGRYLLFDTYSLFEALYETPFYWMGADKEYAPTALTHRGLFTEEFARERLAAVFGPRHVDANVNIQESKSKRVGEIDVLVTVGDRAIVLQAKSKRLTLESRKGNDRQIQEDFKKSVQDAYDQGYLCASVLNDSAYAWTDASGNAIPRRGPFKEIYVVCVVSDHYPSLAFQARQFLKVNPSELIQPPFVLDVFSLDVMAEMLESPLRFLSYVNRRTHYDERIVAAHELTTLAYHLKKNLWLEEATDLLMLSDDVSVELMIAMAARRDGVVGQETPDGVLTRFKGTPLAALIEEIEMRAEPAAIDLGFLLLTLGEEAVDLANRAIPHISAMVRRDGNTHDFTVGVGKEPTGITIHCSREPDAFAAEALRDHCLRRKYLHRADTWYGICIGPLDERLRFALKLDFPWAEDPKMAAIVQGLGTPLTVAQAQTELQSNKQKVGRNDPCPCGSGRKYKKCCLRS